MPLHLLRLHEKGFSGWMVDQKGFLIDIWPVARPVLASLSHFSGVQAMVMCMRCMYTIIAWLPMVANMIFPDIFTMVLISVVRHPELLISMIFWILLAVPGYLEWAGTRIVQRMNDKLQLAFGFLPPLSTPTPALAVPFQLLNPTDATITNILSALAMDQQTTRQMLEALASERGNQPQPWSLWLLPAATCIVARMLN